MPGTSWSRRRCSRARLSRTTWCSRRRCGRCRRRLPRTRTARSPSGSSAPRASRRASPRTGRDRGAAARAAVAAQGGGTCLRCHAAARGHRVPGPRGGHRSACCDTRAGIRHPGDDRGVALPGRTRSVVADADRSARRAGRQSGAADHRAAGACDLQHPLSRASRRWRRRDRARYRAGNEGGIRAAARRLRTTGGNALHRAGRPRAGGAPGRGAAARRAPLAARPRSVRRARPRRVRACPCGEDCAGDRTFRRVRC